VAPLEAFHTIVGFGDTPVEPFDGDAWVGADGAPDDVVKLLVDE